MTGKWEGGKEKEKKSIKQTSPPRVREEASAIPSFDVNGGGTKKRSWGLLATRSLLWHSLGAEVDVGIAIVEYDGGQGHGLFFSLLHHRTGKTMLSRSGKGLRTEHVL